MRTEIQGNGFLSNYCSEFSRDCNATVVTGPLYHLNQFAKNGQNHESSQTSKDGVLGHGKGEIRKTILKHETIFRNQVRELHRLYFRQRELMNEMKRVKVNKDEHNIPFISLIQGTQNSTGGEISLSKSINFDKRADALQIPANVLGINVENQMQKSFYKFPLVENNCRNQNHLASFDNSAFDGVWRSECKVDSSRPYLFMKKSNYQTGDSTGGNLSSLSCLARADVSVNSGSTFHLASTNFYEYMLPGEKGGICLSNEDSRNEMHTKEHLSDNFTDFCFGKSQTFSKGMLAESRTGYSDNPSGIRKSASRKKQMLFGVEISEENDDPMDTLSNRSSIIIKNDLIDCKNTGYSAPGKCFKNVDETNSKPIENSKRDSEHSQNFQMAVPQQNPVFTDCQSNAENLKGGLLRFLENPQQSDEPNKGENNPYFMNLDSLQNCSNGTFKKTETSSCSFPTLKPNQEFPAPMASQIADNGIPRMVLCVNNPNPEGNISQVNCSGIDGGGSGCEKEQLENKDFVSQKGLNNYISGLRYHIDLNLSFEEEDAQPAPTLPKAIVKIAATEIDLESPAVIETEPDVSPEETDLQPRESHPSNEECDRLAAETIVTFSMSGKKYSNEEVTREPLEATSSDCLKWFAETIMSNCGVTMRKVSLIQNGACHADESIPHGMDCFEFMTLKLEDTKEEYYSYKPMELNNPRDEEKGDATFSERSRKGMPNRGRQLKDFQNDVLPGLVTLSRQEVTEDLKIFEGLPLKGEGRSSPRNGRGRKRFRVLTISPVSKSVYSTVTQQPSCQKLGLEGRNIVGWGKRTRRLRRHSCPNAHLSLPLKC